MFSPTPKSILARATHSSYASPFLYQIDDTHVDDAILTFSRRAHSVQHPEQARFHNAEGWTPLHLFARLNLREEQTEKHARERRAFESLFATCRRLFGSSFCTVIDAPSLNRHGCTPLMVACDRGNIYTAKLLVSFGANVRSVSRTGWTPCKIAALHGYEQVLRYLVDAERVRCPDEDGDVFIDDTRKRRISRMHYVRDLRDMRDMRDMRDLRDLRDMRAMRQMSEGRKGRTREYARYVRCARCARGGRYGTGREWRQQATTPLMLACINGHTEAARVLLEAGADPNAVCENGETVLMHALSTRRRRAEILSLLLRAGADPNAVSGNTKTLTPMLKTCWEGDLVSLRVLVEEGGAQTGWHPSTYSSPSLVAAGSSNPGSLQAMVYLLREELRRAHVFCGPLVAARSGLMTRSHNVFGMTLLYAATLSGDHEKVAWLLAHGSLPSIFDVNPCTGKSPVAVARERALKTADFRVLLVIGYAYLKFVADVSATGPRCYFDRSFHQDAEDVVLASAKKSSDGGDYRLRRSISFS